MFATLLKAGKQPDNRPVNPGALVREVLADSGMTEQQMNEATVTNSATGEHVSLDTPITASITLIVGQAVAGA